MADSGTNGGPATTAAATESTDFEEPIAQPKFGPVVLAYVP
jgi:hypothetical protein